MVFGEHTSKNIIGTKSKELLGKRIIVCVTGSVAAIKSPDVARELMRRGADVYVVMTKMAERVVHPDMLEWSTGNPVVKDLTGAVEHVSYGGEHGNKADLILVAPSTANTIGKAAAGIDDTPVTTLLTTAIGARIPVIFAPAMHASMYKHPIVIENISKLERIGVHFLMPRFEEDKAKMLDAEEIVQAVIAKLSKPQDLKGKRILITAGATRAYIDAFRYITNPSSGKMGIAIADDALERGAEVTLIYGSAQILPQKNVKLIQIETTEEMFDSVVAELKASKYDAVVLSAAVSDWGPAERVMEKIPSNKGKWILELVALPKIVSQVKKIDPEVLLVGFKAEYDISKEELINRSYKRLMEMKMDFIVANDVSKKNTGFNVDTNEVYIINAKKSVVHIPLTSKKEVAGKLLDIIKENI